MRLHQKQKKIRKKELPASLFCLSDTERVGVAKKIDGNEERRKSLLICSFERKSVSSCGSSSSNKTSSHQLDHRCWLHPQDSFLFLLIFFPQRLACWLLIFFSLSLLMNSRLEICCSAKHSTSFFSSLLFSPHHFHHSHHHLFDGKMSKGDSVCVCVGSKMLANLPSFVYFNLPSKNSSYLFSACYKEKQTDSKSTNWVQEPGQDDINLHWLLFFLLHYFKFKKMVLLLSLRQKQYYNNNFA